MKNTKPIHRDYAAKRRAEAEKTLQEKKAALKYWQTQSAKKADPLAIIPLRYTIRYYLGAIVFTLLLTAHLLLIGCYEFGTIRSVLVSSSFVFFITLCYAFLFLIDYPKMFKYHRYEQARAKKEILKLRRLVKRCDRVLKY